MPPRTIFLSRLFGLYCLLVGLAMAARGREFVATATMLADNPPLLLLAGVLALLAGLAAVLSHNSWSGGAPTVAVTAAGWAALIKGLLILLLPSGAVSGLVLGGLHYDLLFGVYTAAALGFGAYLTFAGFSSHK